MAAEKISFKFLGDARDLIDATRGAQRALDKTEDSSSRTRDALGRMDDTIKNLAIGIGAAELGQFAYQSIQMADQAEALAESARTVLGPELDTLRSNLEDVRGMMGLNIGELDGLAAQFGLLTESMGLTDEQQRTFIENTLGVAGELAAFKGDIGLTQEAVESLAGAYKGEFDSLENWGIKLSAAAVQARKLEIAARDGNEELTDQQLELEAITELINEAAAPAFGSLADAAGDSAAKSNELKTKWEDLQILIGTILSPALEWLLDLVLNAVDAWGRLTDKAEFWNTRLGHWTRSIMDFVNNVLAPFKTALGAIRDGFQWIIDKVQILIGWLDRISFPDIPSWVPFIGDDGAGKGGVVGSDIVPKTPGSVSGGGARSFGSPATGGSPPGVHVTVEAGLGDPQAIARKVVEVLQVYQQTNGALPITVTGVEE